MPKAKLFDVNFPIIKRCKISFEVSHQEVALLSSSHACRFFFFFFFFSESLCQIKQGIQDSIANVQYPNYKDINTQNEKEANIKVKLMKVWI